MIVENEEALQNWLISYLETLSRCPVYLTEALTKCVISNIKRDKPEKDLKDYIIKNRYLNRYLSDQTIIFVDTLFQTIADKSYLNAGSAPASSATTASTMTSTTTPNVLRCSNCNQKLSSCSL